MTLDVVIATYRPEGIARVAEMNLPRVDNVKYIVSWQAHADAPVPQTLLRDDIKIIRMEGKGLSRNRNNAISHSEADIIYISDDDIVLMPGALETIMKRFEAFPDTDVATFQMKESHGKQYPEKITDLSFYLPKNYHVGSCQMAFRRKLFPGLKFSEQFGINSGVFEAGEDELFHLAARKGGLKCRYFPDVVASHPHEATGDKKITDMRVVEAMGAVITMSFPRSFFLRLPVKARRLHKSGMASAFPALLHLAKGSLKSFRMRRELLKIRKVE